MGKFTGFMWSVVKAKIGVATVAAALWAGAEYHRPINQLYYNATQPNRLPVPGALTQDVGIERRVVNGSNYVQVVVNYDTEEEYFPLMEGGYPPVDISISHLEEQIKEADDTMARELSKGVNKLQYMLHQKGHGTNKPKKTLPSPIGVSLTQGPDGPNAFLIYDDKRILLDEETLEKLSQGPTIKDYKPGSTSEKR